MIILINGAFGVGKTSVATELVRTLDNFMLFDPEVVGFMLRHVIPDEIRTADERTDNFQDLALWKSMTVTMAENLRKTYNKNLIIPMTIFNKDYLHYIFSGLKKIDEDTFHFCLTAKEEIIHNRLLQRGETAGNWCFIQTEKCLAAYEDRCFETFIKTDDLGVDGVVKKIQRDVGLMLQEKF